MKEGQKKNQSEQSSVKVIIRIRPLISIEKQTKKCIHVEANDQILRINANEHSEIQIKFDHVIDQYRTQKEMFQLLSQNVSNILNGYNMTIFAYGQTGSGKTYTMFGRDWENSFDHNLKIKKQKTPLTDISNDKNFSGLIPRSAFHIFSSLQNHTTKYNVFCSFLQIYNEKIYDLLNDSPKPHSLQIHESKVEGVFVEGLGEFEVNEYTDILQLIRRGEKNRFIRQTSMNAKSSRSHTVFQILLESTNVNADGIYTKAKLNLCDLAGSEKINKKQNMATDHLQQLKNINLSLTTLGKVIYSLSNGTSKKNSYFRQSKLTRILQSSLIGNTQTYIIGNVSPSSKNIEETMNTLKFVERARHIKMKVKPTSITSDNSQLVKKLQDQLEHLRGILIEKSRQKSQQQINEQMKVLMKENENLKSAAKGKQTDLEKMIRENRQMKVVLHRLEMIAMADFSQNHSDGSQSERSMSKQFRSVLQSSRKSRQGRDNEQSLRSPLGKSQKEKEIGYNRSMQPMLPIIEEKSKKLPILYLQTLEQDRKRGRKIDEMNQSLNKIEKPKQRYVNREKQKKNIIKKLESIESVKKSQVNHLLKDLSTVERQNRSDELREIKRIQEQTTQSIRNKGRGKSDYAQKIRQLEMKLYKR